MRLFGFMLLGLPVMVWAADGPCLSGNGCLTVGPNPNCAAVNLQDALDDLLNSGAVNQEIRAVAGNYGAPVDAINRNLTLRGGYANCTDALNGNTPPDGARSSINLPTPVLDVRALRIGADISPVQPFQYLIDRFDFRNGVKVDVPAFSILGDDGAGILIDCPNNSGNYPNCANVRIRHSTIENNAANNGGGIAVRGATLTLDQGVRVQANQAGDGGGVSCLKGTVNLDGSDARLQGNQTELTNDGAGGGLLGLGCQVTLRAGGYGPSRGGVIGNRAMIGGGVAVLGGTLRLGDRTLATPAVLADNISNPNGVTAGFGLPLGGGGALSANSSGLFGTATVQAEKVLISNNRAGDPSVVGVPGFTGGVSIGADVVVNWHLDSFDCSKGCMRFENNRATHGPAALSMQARPAVMDGLVFLANQSPFSILYVRNQAGPGATVPLLMNSLFAQNDDPAQSLDPDSIIALEGQLSMYFNTLVDNDSVLADVDLQDSDTTIDTTIDFRGNILRAANSSVPPLRNLVGAAVFGNCNAVHSGWVGLFQLFSTYVDEAPPSFVDADVGDYRLTSGASQVDACGQTELLLAATAGSQDLQGQPRPVDVTYLSNFNGPFDIGALEFQQNDLFANSFE